jgi:DNA-binding Lrp family transcriptional regulator
MDLIDKQIILELFGNCRITYRSLSKKIGLSTTNVRKRVLKLRNSGLVSRGYVLLSLAMLDAEYLICEITTDGSEIDESFVEQVCVHPAILNLVRRGPCEWLIHGEAIGSLGLFDLGRFLRSFDCVENVDLHFVHPITPSPLPGHHQYVYLGQKVKLTEPQLKVLKHLWLDARTPATEIAKLTDYTARRVQQIIRYLKDSRGLYFTVITRFSAAGIVPFLIDIEYNEKQAEAHEVVKWVQEQFPFEYWNAWRWAGKPKLVHFCTTTDIQSVEQLMEIAKTAPFATRVVSHIFYPQNHHVGLGHIRLGELLGHQVRNHKVEFYSEGNDQYY